MIKSINIISFDVPYPANYGGVIDVFYKIKYFHKKGIKIHLHCFEYGRGEQVELNKYCESVNYYQRKTGVISFLSSTPYIVKSRISEQLKTNLLTNDFPILFEGLHTCFLLDDPSLKNRFKIVRNHNIEHDYYNHLALVEQNTAKRKYFKSETKKLQYFESILKNADLCLAISDADFNYFSKKYIDTKFLLIPPFHQNNEVKVKKGKGDYVLYHGNLSVAENLNAAINIINNVFHELTIPLIIAGLNPPKELLQLVEKYKNISILQNPSDEEMNDLITNAQINFLYTEQATGLKLKLLNVLYNGRFCVVNSKMVQGTSLAGLCIVEDDVSKVKEMIQDIFEEEIEPLAIEKRKALLLANYSNEKNFNAIMKELRTINTL
jgi:cell division protein ZapA (FtsZ GTPase activity inhibitor)